ncbi:MAG: HNH endonuclease [Azospirillaceae bacterium]|nr:HNH endonuclease [Azospirillaceae bacterium]
MTKAVLTTKVEPSYDDLPEQRYHFPRTYLRQVEAALGDFIVYYEPRRSSGNLSSRGGRQAYFATARIVDIEPDTVHSDHFYAKIKDYLEFVRPVPFQEGRLYYESALQRDDGKTNKGAFGRAVRPLSPGEYDRIAQAGFAPVIAAPAADRPGDAYSMPGFAEEPATFERPIVERIIARPFRDDAFSGMIKAAYGDTCAMTGLKIINGGGRSEVQAAHIRPVAESGPDSVRNGIALCGTLHWMFDRGLVSLDDEYRLLLAPGKVPDPVQRMITPDRLLLRPERADQLPHPQFLRWHREFRFKG